MPLTEQLSWDSPVVERTKEAGQLLLETERDGRRELRINSVQPPGPFAGEQVAGLLQTYLASPTRPGTHLQVPYETFAVTGSTGDGVEDRLHQTRGASAISFEDGKKIPAAVQSSLRRLHQNLAHPSREDLVRHLRPGRECPRSLGGCQAASLSSLRQTPPRQIGQAKLASYSLGV